MKRPSKSDGDGGANARNAAVSAGPPTGPTVIQFRSPAASAGAREDAGVSSASASSFVQIGIPARAVVMRIKQGLPRIRVERAAEGDFAARSDQSASWEDEERR